MHSRVLGTCLTNLWHFTKAYIKRGNSIPLPSYVYIAFTHPKITRRILEKVEKDDIAAHVTRRCVGALVVNKLAADINLRILPVNDAELACLSAILGIDSEDVTLLLSHPGGVQFANMVLLVLLEDIHDPPSWIPTSDVLD